METEELVACEPISSSKILCTAVNKTNGLGIDVKCPIFMSDLNRVPGVSTDFSGSRRYQISRKSVQWGRR